VDKRVFAKKVIAILLIAFVIDTAVVVFMNISHYRSKPPRDLPSDTVGMIFFRGSDPTGRFLRRDTLRRANKAVLLYRKGAISMIACIGGARAGHDRLGSEMVKDFLVSRGIPDNKILVDRESYDSRTNCQVVRKLAREYGWPHITLIASPMHNQRLRTIIGKAPLDNVQVFYSSYSYLDCNPSLSWKELWVDTHYEWLAYAAEFILPDVLYSRAIRLIR
jgi:uncharacterized SAM-binding protein YcdF (DUF218 family)